MLEPYFRNGGMIGVTLDFATEENYPGAGGGGAGAIEYVSDTGRITLSSSTLTLPSGLEPGDLVIVASTSDGTTPATPTGYTQGLRTRPNSTGAMWAYKFMPDPVDTVVTGLTNNNTTTHMAVAFRGVDQTTPLDVTPPNVTSAITLTPNPPAITTLTDGAMIVALGFLDDDTVATTAGAPAGYTFAGASRSTNAIGGTVMAAYLVGTTAGSFDPGAFSGGNDNWVGATLALRPGAEVSLGNKKNSGIWDVAAILDSIVTGVSPPPPLEDVTPNAVNWNNLNTGGSTATTNTQTIAGIDTAIILQATFTEDRDNYTLQALVNGGLVGSPVNSPGNFTFTVNNNDTVAFRASGGDTRSSTATITNVSDGDAVLDTFNVTLNN